ncbi:MAG: tetratricopeptide repeat protein, partial [Tepidisphaeraceae bacterium]
LYRAGGDYTNAAVQYEAAAKLDPYGYVNHLNLGVSYQLLNRFQEAAASYLKALRLNPGDVESNMNLGLVYLALGQVDDAVHYLEIATTLDPHNAIALANLGVALDAQGSHARAESAYRKSLDLKADQSTTILNLGTNLLSQQKPTEAIAVLRTVVKKSDSASVRKRFGDAFAQAGRYEEAIQEYMACLKLDSRYYPAMNDMGRVLVARYYASSEMDEEMRRLAVRYWRASLQINPSQPRVVTLIKEWDRTRL